jgi:hypothetical protein
VGLEAGRAPARFDSPVVARPFGSRVAAPRGVEGVAVRDVVLVELLVDFRVGSVARAFGVLRPGFAAGDRAPGEAGDPPTPDAACTPAPDAPDPAAGAADTPPGAVAGEADAGRPRSIDMGRKDSSERA